jgi:predicted O-methyltransferase YrrM|tara:strand:- start:287 stop:784 length:498 start_codon:yes stop_codon:yes gene_type:complete
MKSRNELAKLGWTTGVELGVARGDFSNVLLDGGADCRRLYSIDRWADHHDMKEYFDAMETLRVFGRQSTVIRATFDEALTLFPDNFFDFIYIDGYAHTGQDGGKTIRDWWRKLALGGLFAGHDYSEKYPKTIEAVDRFVKDYGVTLNITDGSDRFQSWWIRKVHD